MKADKLDQWKESEKNLQESEDGQWVFEAFLKNIEKGPKETNPTVKVNRNLAVYGPQSRKEPYTNCRACIYSSDGMCDIWNCEISSAPVNCAWVKK